MANKLLVANRAEIACRVFQTCREMGIPTVGIYTAADIDARHVTYADEVIEVESYLDIDAIIRAAKKTRANLIHPGYGFLSERSAFARAVEKAGKIFVGPRGETMDQMGEKIAAKSLAKQLKVPTLPWEKVEPGFNVASVAKKIGFPMLIKAAAGGGGKGMRRVESEKEFAAAAESAAAEAIAAFGDGTLFIERLIEKPRHIEVQIFGYGDGRGVHLFERECSLQRRHQKVWEEAPAIRLPEATKKGLHQASLKLLRATKYRNAGTVEFLVDSKNKFYFLEMNTRLQVEHPVTEYVTGVDLVRAQIELALDPKKFSLKVPKASFGHSIEVRLYAEDPAQGFMPTPGKITELIWPKGLGIRVESGVERGQELTTQFDSMIAKLVVWAEDRTKAIERLKFALDETVILGIGTNQSYLRELCDHPQVVSGKVDTFFLGEAFKDFAPKPSDETLEILKQVYEKGVARGKIGASQTAQPSRHPSPWEQLDGGLV